MNSDIKILSIFTDGGARGNPGPAACAFVVQDKNDRQIANGAKYLGTATNNLAELEGVSLALSWLYDNHSQFTSLETIIFFLDSQLITNQLLGNYKIKNPALILLHNRIKVQQQEIDDQMKPKKIFLNFKNIPRAQNYFADKLLNQVLDSKTSSSLL